MFDDESLFAVIPVVAMIIHEHYYYYSDWPQEVIEFVTPYVRSALERDENRFRTLLKNENWELMQVVTANLLNRGKQ